MTKPYEGEENYCGYPIHTDEELNHYIELALEKKQQLLAHCNGDAAAERITLQTDAWKNVEGNSPVNYTFGVEGNNVDRHARLLDNSILAYSPDGEQIVIALYETGDDAKARTVFFTYDGEKLQETGSLQADIRRCQYWILDAAPEGKWVLLEE